MSELKAYTFSAMERIGLAEYYLKPEADKEIAELKKACNDKDDWCLHTLRENRLNKYKRCLAMAEACMHKRWRTDEGFDYARSTRHMNKWLEIAEKFKDGK